jgi:hypothetical protein
VKKFFKNESALFWLKFIEAQLILSNRYVLRTESRDVAAFEVAEELAEMRSLVKNRKANMYIAHEAQSLLSTLDVDEQEEIHSHVVVFYNSLDSYLDKWSKNLDGTDVFCWMKLAKALDWAKDIMPAVNFMKKHHQDSDLSVDDLYDEFPRLQHFVDDNRTRWESEKFTTENKWLEVLRQLKEQHRAIPCFSLLAQYAFAMPGTSAEVERLFSIIKHVWGSEKGQLSMNALEAHLEIKYNDAADCREFFNRVKGNKKMLSEVNSSEKYKN